MFFEPPYLWHMLWCVGLIAESRRSRGKVWKRPSLPADDVVVCIAKENRQGEDCALFVRCNCSLDFSGGHFLLGKCSDHQELRRMPRKEWDRMRGQTIWQRGLTALFAAVFMAALLVGCGQDAKQAAGSYT